MKSGRERVEVPPQNQAYPSGKLPIKRTKLKNLENILHYIPDEHITFYRDLLNWSSTPDHEDDE